MQKVEFLHHGSRKGGYGFLMIFPGPDWNFRNNFIEIFFAKLFQKRSTFIQKYEKEQYSSFQPEIASEDTILL